MEINPSEDHLFVWVVVRSTAQPIVILGYVFDSPPAKYLLVLAIVAVMALAAKNMARGNVGRQWMAIRDMDVAAEVIGMGRRALDKAAAYAAERVVFGRPIGMNQSIQHPLAECWAELFAAELMTLHAAELYDAGQPCGAQANAAKLLAADAGFHAADRAVRTHGGMGYAADYHVERYFREMVATQLAPVSREMILCFIAERELGLPKSY